MTYRLSGLLSILVLFLIVSCDSSGVNDKPKESTEATLRAEAVKTSGDRIDTATLYVDSTQIGSGVGETEVSPGSDVEVRADAANYFERDSTVSVPEDITSNETVNVVLTLEKSTPDSVRTTLEIRDATADTAVSADRLYFADQLIGENVADTTFRTAYSDEPVDLRVESEYFEDKNSDFTPNKDRQLEIGLNRKMVELDVAVVDSANKSPVDSALVSVINPASSADTLELGFAPLTRSFPARSGRWKIRAERPGWKSSSALVSADTSIEETLEIQDMINCRDNFDNDHDGKKDENDPGCLDENGEYDPTDDDEAHVFVRYTSISGGVREDDSTYISSSRNKRELIYPGNGRVFDFPPSIVDAVVADAGIDTKRNADQPGEGFDAVFKCGPSENNLNNINTTGLVADTQEQNGWAFTLLPDVSIDYFETGGVCRVTFRHQSLVEGNPPGDGNDDVIFVLPDGEQRAFTVYFFVEAENFQQSNQQGLQTQSGGRLNAITNGYPADLQR